LVFDDGDGARRAAVGGLSDALVQLLAGVLVEHVEEPVLAHLEDLGSDAHAHGVAGALVVVHYYLHLCLRTLGGRAECTGPPLGHRGTGRRSHPPVGPVGPGASAARRTARRRGGASSRTLSHGLRSASRGLVAAPANEGLRDPV